MQRLTTTVHGCRWERWGATAALSAASLSTSSLSRVVSRVVSRAANRSGRASTGVSSLGGLGLRWHLQLQPPSQPQHELQAHLCQPSSQPSSQPSGQPSWSRPLSSLSTVRARWTALGDRRQRRHVSDKPRPPLSTSSSSSSTPSTTSSTSPSLTTRRENIYTLPNMLTVGRILAAPFIGYCILHDLPGTALSLVFAAGLSDLLDGWMARRWHLRTVVGSILDPMADKILMTVLVGSLAAHGGALPLWLAALILGRDAGLGIAAIYYRYISLPPPKTLARYWDFSLPSAEVRPTTISKYNTFLQLALMAATMTVPVAADPALTASVGGPWDLTGPLTGLQYVVATTTVWSGLSYVYSKDAVKILTQKRVPK